MKSWNGNEERLSRSFLHVFYAQSEILRASIYFSFCPSSEFKFDQISCSLSPIGEEKIHFLQDSFSSRPPKWVIFRVRCTKDVHQKNGPTLEFRKNYRSCLRNFDCWCLERKLANNAYQTSLPLETKGIWQNSKLRAFSAKVVKVLHKRATNKVPWCKERNKMLFAEDFHSSAFG